MSEESFDEDEVDRILLPRMVDRGALVISGVEACEMSEGVSHHCQEGRGVDYSRNTLS